MRCCLLVFGKTLAWAVVNREMLGKMKLHEWRKYKKGGMALKPKDMLHHKVKFIMRDVNLAIANVTKY